MGRKEWNMGQRASDTRGVNFEDVLVPKEVTGADKHMYMVVIIIYCTGGSSLGFYGLHCVPGWLKHAH